MKIACLLTLLDFVGTLWKKEWWPGTELNRRHIDFQSTALPTELPGHLLQKLLNRLTEVPTRTELLKHLLPIL